ncbi:hypothetical protein DCS32_11660 [Dokdonia sp. Dokd-P16]|uniref:DUF7822 domain-containing protein n=1 Tax=Dokdonia sp. Dokd-P16 TaxID=2173169 RepID=UPI000D5490C8|nr:hypothetical protein [Dokdonia sp. Dokd-P16]AWH74789.1 hypothetical protein DCS32_11660 [Dokdonia sp. Dokd-P16]
MANRSYLYNIDFNRLERLKTPQDAVLSVSEYAYGIPLAYKILLSNDTLNSKTILWDYEHPITISGNAKKGKDSLFKFLDKLRTLNLFEEEYLESEIEKTKLFFNENTFDLQYFFLEAGELYEMGDEPFEIQNLEIFNEVTQIEKTIEAFIKDVASIDNEIKKLIAQQSQVTKKSWFKKSKPVLSEEEIATINKAIDNKHYEKKALLGIDNWSTILYFQFDQL